MFINKRHLQLATRQGHSLWWGYKILLIVLILLGGLQLILANHVATFGARLGELSWKIENLSQESAAAEASLGRYSSLGWLASQGGELGLTKSPRVVFVNSVGPVALR